MGWLFSGRDYDPAPTPAPPSADELALAEKRVVKLEKAARKGGWARIPGEGMRWGRCDEVIWYDPRGDILYRYAGTGAPFGETYSAEWVAEAFE